MPRGKAPDPRKRKTRHPDAQNFKIPNGKEEAAHLAGEMYGCETHRTDTSKPCVQAITEGKLRCPYCADGLESVWRGYVPLWDRDWALRYALIGKTIYDSVAVIEVGAQVVVSRAKNPISPLIVREQNHTLRSLPKRSPWSEPIEMIEVCLTLWQHEALANWFAKHPEAKLTIDTTEFAKEVADPGLKRMQNLMAKEERERVESELLDDSISKTINRVFKPAQSANGVYKAPQKPR